MRFRLLQSPVIRIRRAVAPGGLVCPGCGFHRSLCVAFCPLDVCQDVIGVSLVKGIRSACSDVPDFVESGSGTCKMSLLTFECRNGDEGREFELDNVDGSRPGEGKMEALVCPLEVTQAKGRLTLT